MRIPRTPRRAAFTLLEIMLVVAIIVLLLGTAFAMLGPQIDIGRDTRLMADFRGIENALQAYEGFAGNLPTTEQGLAALVTQPTGDPQPQRWYQQLKALPKDPWGQDYVYVVPGVHNPKSFDLYSKGKDRVAGTEDDRGNWDPKLR